MKTYLFWIRKHPWQFLVQFVVVLAGLAAVFNWIGITPQQLGAFFTRRFISLTIPETLLIGLLPSYISYRFFAKRYPVVNSKLLKNLKARVAKESNYPAKVDELMQQWQELFELVGELEIEVIDTSMQNHMRRLAALPKPARGYIYEINWDCDFALHYNKTHDYTVTELESLAKTLPSIQNYVKGIKVFSLAGKFLSKDYAVQHTKAGLRRVIDTLENIKKSIASE